MDVPTSFKFFTDQRYVVENLYYTLFDKIPSQDSMYNIEFKKLHRFLLKENFELIFYKSSEYEKWDTTLIKDDVILAYNVNNKGAATVTLTHSDVKKIEPYVKKISRMKAVVKSTVGLLIQDHTGLNVYDTDCKQIDLDLELNYGDNFTEKHERIMECLNSNSSSGIILLHSVPGAGKSTYIQYLCNKIEKRFIFVPSNIALNLAAPSFISLLMNNKNCILVIEDAEKIIKSRDLNGSSEISDLLNISDGILGSLLNIKIIATYNTKRENIDQALLRKGRLMCEHEFKKLSIDNSKKLAIKLHGEEVADNVSEEMTLADIYHMTTKNYKSDKPASKLGFKLN